MIDDDDEPSAEEIRRFDRKRKKKKVANAEWKSSSDDDARITKMKDGRTRFSYEAEHMVDLQTQVVLSATVQHSPEPDTQTLLTAVEDGQANLEAAGSDAEITEVAADKGYHSNAQITECSAAGLRTYVPAPASPRHRQWTDKPDEVRTAVLNNRRRTKRPSRAEFRSCVRNGRSQTDVASRP